MSFIEYLQECKIKLWYIKMFIEMPSVQTYKLDLLLVLQQSCLFFYLSTNFKMKTLIENEQFRFQIPSITQIHRGHRALFLLKSI